MKKLVDMLLTDLSTREVFAFRISCGTCKAVYSGKPVKFSKAGIIPPTPKKIVYDLVYEQEYQAARQIAVGDAAEHLNYCPICKRLVCNRCFLICDDLDMCKQCAAHLDEKGIPVLADVLDTVI